jgi:2,4-dienoyl-CoA reductase-like NADH-dependent reductase (Old Yellow Enzyme family)
MTGSNLPAASALPAGAGLFDALKIRGLTLSNRIVVSPMCEYSCANGFANDWHLVHLGSRAVGGAGLVITEATAVAPNARISPQDLGIWSDAHIEPLARITRFLHSQGSASGIQLAHAGRKASTYRPWSGSGKIAEEEGGWRDVVAPSAIPFSPDYPMPITLTEDGIAAIVRQFGEAAHRAAQAGFRLIEIHSAHGYLLHEFLSPLSNKRTDRYGGSFENRTRIVRVVVQAIRQRWPEKYPLFIRISSTEWTEGGFEVEDSVALARMLAPLGVDLIDCSSGGNVLGAKIPSGPGYQVKFAERVRREAGVLTGAVGMITEPAQAEQILRSGQADLVILAREMLRNPYWPIRAAEELGQTISLPVQYLRAGAPGASKRQPAPNVD